MRLNEIERMKLAEKNNKINESRCSGLELGSMTFIQCERLERKTDYWPLKNFALGFDSEKSCPFDVRDTGVARAMYLSFESNN